MRSAGWWLGAECQVLHRVQARSSIPDTKARIKESEKRIDTSLDSFVKKQYWCGHTCGCGPHITIKQ